MRLVWLSAGLFGFATAAHGINYRCQIFTKPGLFLRNIVWDGSTPFETPLELNGVQGALKVSSIGLPGHPDYAFSVVAGQRLLLTVSQERNLKDYNLTWRSDSEDSEAFINIACRTAGDE